MRKPRPTSRLFRRIGDQSGMTTVEFALVAPTFFLFIFVSFEFCRLNMIRNLTQDAAYFAARHCMVPGATSAEAIEKANEILGYMNTDGATVIINENEEIGDDTDLISVTVSVPVADNSLLVPKFTGDVTFSATATLRTERYDGYYDPFSD